MTRPPSLYAHGFATLVTVAMLIFVSMAVMTMTRLTALDTRRTQQVKAGAQQRQLLLAGAAAAVGTLRNDPAFIGTTRVQLPARLQWAEVILTVQAGDTEDERTAVVRVMASDQTLQQVIQLVATGDKWVPMSTIIEQLP